MFKLKYLSSKSLFALSLLLIASESLASPLGAVKGRTVPLVDSTGTAAADIILTPGLFSPVAQLPGAIGSIKYASDGSQILIVLGGSASPGAVDEILRAGYSASRIRALGKDFFAIVMTPLTEDGSVRVILANDKGVKKVVMGKAKVAQGSIFVTDWAAPNLIASAVLANTRTAGGAKFLAEDYEIAFGTHADGRPYFVILDRVQGKIVTFGNQGAHFADLTPQVKNLYATTIGLQLLNAPRIIVAND